MSLLSILESTWDWAIEEPIEPIEPEESEENNNSLKFRMVINGESKN